MIYIYNVYDVYFFLYFCFLFILFVCFVYMVVWFGLCGLVRVCVGWGVKFLIMSFFVCLLLWMERLGFWIVVFRVSSLVDEDVFVLIVLYMCIGYFCYIWFVFIIFSIYCFFLFWSNYMNLCGDSDKEFMDFFVRYVWGGFLKGFVNDDGFYCWSVWEFLMDGNLLKL